MKKNLFSGALSVFLFGSCLFSTSFPCFAEKPYSAGTIYNRSNTQIGSISGDGSIYNNTTGQQVGQISGNGSVYDSSHRQIAHVGSDGSIYNDTTSQQVGQVTANGSVYDSNHRQIGSVSGNGSVYNQAGQQIGQVPPGNPAVAYGMLQGQSGSAGFGYTSVEQWEAEIRKMQAPQPVPQGQPSCFAGCMPLPPPSFKHKINIRTLNGFLVGWADQSGGIKLEANALPALHLNPPIGDKYSGVDTMLFFPDFGVSRVITRLLFDEEIVRLQKYNPERGKALIDNMAIPMGYVDQFGNITDLQGKKIAYEEVGDTVYDSHADEKEARDQAGEEFGYPNVLGVFEPNGDVRDVHNRLVGHLEESQRDDPRDGTGQPAALKLIQKYEKQHPWHPAGRKITKSGK